MECKRYAAWPANAAQNFDTQDTFRVRHNHCQEALRQAPTAAPLYCFRGIPCLFPPRFQLPPDANKHRNCHSYQSGQRQCQNRKKNLDDHRVLAYQSRGKRSELSRTFLPVNRLQTFYRFFEPAHQPVMSLLHRFWCRFTPANCFQIQALSIRLSGIHTMAVDFHCSAQLLICVEGCEIQNVCWNHQRLPRLRWRLVVDSPD